VEDHRQLPETLRLSGQTQSTPALSLYCLFSAAAARYSSGMVRDVRPSVRRNIYQLGIAK